MIRVRKDLRLHCLLAAALIIMICGSVDAQVAVVNIIPNGQSNEENQDSEPNLAVNPVNPLEIAASAFTPDPLGGANAPIYVSTDGGNTWVLNSIVPSQAGSISGTSDITLRFSGSRSVLYAGILRRPGTLRLNILRTANFTAPTQMAVLIDRNNVDQPYVQATTVMGGGGWGNDRVYIGINDFAAAAGRTATIERSLNAANAPPPAGFTAERIEPRANMGQDLPPIRPVIHPNGTVYAVYYGWRSTNGILLNSDVVVVRDDNWGIGPNPFTDLLDPNDNLAGVRVVQNRAVPFVNATQPGFGQERFVASNLSIAVDPRDSATVYIAWADRIGTTDYTLHVRRSTDSGLNWSGDLQTITDATNPALAINSRGRVGFLYQQLTGTGANQRWVTHLERTDNAFTNVNDLVLADVPANAPTPPVFIPYIGDYIHLMAVGKDFYGIFSANNTPDNANFPNGVTYQRNANFATNSLLDNNNNPTVNISIDPFMVRTTELPAASDFYVSDWNDSSTVFDMGLEPSTNPAFFSTCDVWNRRSNAPGGFNANNQPQSQDPQMVTSGKNYAFARIRRNDSGTSQTVTAHFLYSEFGTGSNYQNAGSAPDPTVNFGSGDTTETMSSGYEWTLPSTTSNHTCLAVEISTPDDPIIAPSVLGHAPGWPDTDLMFINDNNKAQRNMQVYRPSGSGMLTFYGVLHNAALFTRDMEIAWGMAPEVLKKLEKIHIEILGGKGGFHQFGNTITLTDMLPGENRWMEINFYVPHGEAGTLLPIYFNEMVGNDAVNGFAVAVVVSPLAEAMRENLEFHGNVLYRIAAAFDMEEAEESAGKALELSRQKQISEKEYIGFLMSQTESLADHLQTLLESEKFQDLFGIREVLENLGKALESAKAYPVVPTHSRVLHKFDAFMTMLQKTKGDPADILQNVRWQMELYSKVGLLKELDFSGHIIKKSQEFITAYGYRKIGNEDYPKFIEGMLEEFRLTADALEAMGLDLENDIVEITNKRHSPALLQKAHRDFLLKLHGMMK